MTQGRKTALTMPLTGDQRQTLLAWQRSTTIPAGRARRGRIILLLADRMSVTQIAETVGISRRFVYKWARRFLAEGVARLADKPGRGSPPVPRHQAGPGGGEGLHGASWTGAGRGGALRCLSCPNPAAAGAPSRLYHPPAPPVPPPPTRHTPRTRSQG